MSDEKMTMDDYSAELEASFQKIEEGDILTGTVIAVDETEVTVDLRYTPKESSRRRITAMSRDFP